LSFGIYFFFAILSPQAHNVVAATSPLQLLVQSFSLFIELNSQNCEISKDICLFVGDHIRSDLFSSPMMQPRSRLMSSMGYWAKFSVKRCLQCYSKVHGLHPYIKIQGATLDPT